VPIARSTVSFPSQSSCTRPTPTPCINLIAAKVMKRSCQRSKKSLPSPRAATIIQPPAPGDLVLAICRERQVCAAQPYGDDGVVWKLRTLRELLSGYAGHAIPEMLAPDGSPCCRYTRGVLRRRPVRDGLVMGSVGWCSRKRPCMAMIRSMRSPFRRQKRSTGRVGPIQAVTRRPGSALYVLPSPSSVRPSSRGRWASRRERPELGQPGPAGPRNCVKSRG
jgi:hypothetical protein